MKGILGRKIGMTEKFTTDGRVIPVTVIEVLDNVVTQIKTTETDGYNAIQLATVDKKEKHSTKQEIGHAKKAGVAPKRFLKEIRVEDVTSYELGTVLKADTFNVGEVVDVTGTSKGKGFQGVIKRHNQSRGPETHGSRYHRRPGSMGTMRPMRVLKGKKLAGHMGSETVTIQNLVIIDVNVNDNYILVSGNVPGAKNSLVLIKSAVKNNKKVTDNELVKYTVEVNEPLVEETTEVVSDTNEVNEVVEEVKAEATTETKENLETTEE